MIQQIPSSNLFMVVVDNKCDCSMFEPITMNPVEIMYILPWPNPARDARPAVLPNQPVGSQLGFFSVTPATTAGVDLFST